MKANKMVMTNRILLFGVLGICLFCEQGIKAEEKTSLEPADCLTKALRSAKPNSESAHLLDISGARGEIVSGQIVFYPKGNTETASCSVSDLRKGEDAIHSSNVKLQWVRYIDITRNTDGLPEDELAAKAPSSIPDPYWEGAQIQIKAGEA
jgi:hypothetical protein